LTRDAYGAWELLARNYLEKAFGVNSPNVSAITDVGKYGAFPMSAGEGFWENHRVESLNTQTRRLAGLIELLETELQLTSQSVVASPSIPATAHRIFLVHGHNDAILHETARLLEKLSQEFVILREQPSQGRTIIEKFESYADVGFAVVLLTGDDRGGRTAEPSDTYLLRARQNVILELGYFLGKLGRSRVCALYQRGVEIPSDYSGVLYVELDDRGAWRWELAKELRAAGFAIDMNHAM
jgi:predicted nucleotide-binding protein